MNGEIDKKILVINGKGKFTNKGFYHFVNNIGGLIELKEYAFEHGDIADETLSRLVSDYMKALDNLKKIEAEIYEILEEDTRTG